MGRIIVVSDCNIKPPATLIRDVSDVAFSTNEGVEVVVVKADDVGCRHLANLASKTDAVVFMIPGMPIEKVSAIGRKLKEKGIKVFLAVCVRDECDDTGRCFKHQGTLLQYVGLADDWYLILTPRFIKHYPRTEKASD